MRAAISDKPSSDAPGGATDFAVITTGGRRRRICGTSRWRERTRRESAADPTREPKAPQKWRPAPRRALLLTAAAAACLAACTTQFSAAGPRTYEEVGAVLSFTQGWEVESRDSDRITFRRSDGSGASISVVDKTPPLDAIKGLILKKGPEDGWTAIEATDVTLAGISAVRVTFEAMDGEELDRTLMYLFNARGRHYTLMFRASLATYDDAEFDRVARSLELL